MISGGCFGNDGKKYVIGGWAWACCCVTEVQRYMSKFYKIEIGTYYYPHSLPTKGVFD